MCIKPCLNTSRWSDFTSGSSWESSSLWSWSGRFLLLSFVACSISYLSIFFENLQIYIHQFTWQGYFRLSTILTYTSTWAILPSLYVKNASALSSIACKTQRFSDIHTNLEHSTERLQTSHVSNLPSVLSLHVLNYFPFFKLAAPPLTIASPDQVS